MAHVTTVLPLHVVPATEQSVGAALHAQRPDVPLHVECALHAVVVPTGQLSAVSAQCTDVVPLLQRSPGVLPVLQKPLGSALQVQAAAPPDPVHDLLWLHATAVSA